MVASRVFGVEMMKKIPVGPTIAHAYRFAFGQFPSILKLMWLPFLGTCLCSLILGSQTEAITRGFATHDFSAMTMSRPLFLLLYVISLLMAFIQMTAIYQLALDRPEARKKFYYFSLAAPLWRLISAFLLLVLVMLALAALYVIAVLIVLFVFRVGLRAAHVSDLMLGGIMALDTSLAFLAGECAFVFCIARFGFLLFAATIAEDRIGLDRAWTLSYRNFWRMFAISLAVLLPFIAVEITAMAASGLLPHLPAPGTTPDQLRALQAEQSVRMAAAIAQIRHYWYISYPVFAVAAALLYGLITGASVFAYRVLTGSETTPSLP